MFLSIRQKTNTDTGTFFDATSFNGKTYIELTLLTYTKKPARRCKLPCILSSSTT
ncbi:hypothetical protein [Bacteroides acidifaciens]|uniref:hypothetical protein n=1 Tax=Bacteroides acidifaciens TaxID=85831 RepID=UPI0025B429A7|nr:hypothetical protein [Bacteroides acidifaciens]